MQRAILDTGVMLAAFLRRDPHHAACRELLASGEWESIVPGLCVTEVAQLLERGAGPMVEATFIESLARAPTSTHRPPRTGPASPNSSANTPTSRSGPSMPPLSL